MCPGFFPGARASKRRHFAGTAKCRGKKSGAGRETIYPDKIEIGSVDADTTRGGIVVSG